MKKLIGLIIGLMISVSVFAKPSDDKIDEMLNNMQDSYRRILFQCYMNNDNSKEQDQMNASVELFSQVTSEILEAIDNGASHKGMMLDNYTSLEAEDKSVELEIDGDVAIVTVGIDDILTQYTFNANGNFSAVRQQEVNYEEVDWIDYWFDDWCQCIC